jgi:hypothetical protein
MFSFKYNKKDNLIITHSKSILIQTALVSLAKLVGTTHGNMQGPGSNPGHHQKKFDSNYPNNNSQEVSVSKHKSINIHLVKSSLENRRRWVCELRLEKVGL